MRIPDLARGHTPATRSRRRSGCSPWRDRLRGTIAEAYLRHRGITGIRDLTALRFHQNCFYRAHEAAPREARPALIAAVTDLKGRITGVHRTWLDPSGCGKAPIGTPRRALGHLLGNGVRFGAATDVLVTGEGIETVLSLRSVMPTIPMAAALSASHLAALSLPAGLERLYIACDADAAGWHACERLARRAQAAGVKVIGCTPAAATSMMISEPTVHRRCGRPLQLRSHARIWLE